MMLVIGEDIALIKDVTIMFSQPQYAKSINRQFGVGTALVILNITPSQLASSRQRIVHSSLDLKKITSSIHRGRSKMDKSLVLEF